MRCEQTGKTLSEVFSPVSEVKNRSRAKSLKKMERVKGIEPSYSAWKAAALPLSYTRAGVDLTRHAGGLNPPLGPLFSLQNGLFPRDTPRPAPLTGADSPPILMFPSTMKGGDPVSFTKRCHLAGIAR